MKRASTWALLLLLGGGATSCRSLLETASFDEGDPSSGSTDSTGTGSSTAASSSGSSTTTGGSSTTTSSGQGTGGEGAGGAATGGGSSSSSGGGGATGCPRSDTFEAGRLDEECWHTVNDTDAQTTFEKGAVIVVPNAATGWFDDGQGVFHFQMVTGDFSATLRLATERTQGTYQLAGFLLRNEPMGAPTATDENWIKWEVGWADILNTTYAGTTVGSDTDIPFYDGEGDPDVTLGVCRRGDIVTLAVRLDAAGDWEDVHTFSPGGVVPNLDDTIQLGFNAAATDSAGLTATIHEFRISPGDLGPCTSALEDLDP